jgi:hypothetical protein
MATTDNISRDCCNSSRALVDMRHIMKQTIKLLSSYYVVDLFGDLVKKKIATTFVHSACDNLCARLPRNRKFILIQIIMKWKRTDAWNALRLVRYNNTRVWRMNRPCFRA